MIFKQKLFKLFDLAGSAVELYTKSIGLGSGDNKSVQMMINLQEQINYELFKTKSFSAMKTNSLEGGISDNQRFLLQYVEWLKYCVNVYTSAEEMPNSVDAEFHILMKYIEISSQENLYADILANYTMASKENQEVVRKLSDEFGHFFGRIDEENGDYHSFSLRAETIKKNYEKYEGLYKKLGDYRSKSILIHTLRNWINLDSGDLESILDNTFCQYFDLDILKLDKNETFVDCGAYLGDSILEFADTVKTYNKVFSYEASKVNYSYLVENSALYKNIIAVNKAVGKAGGTLLISEGGPNSSVGENGEYEVEVASLDDEINEPITLVKMDIEGSEKDALLGMRRHIEQDKPRLMICVYHGFEDITRIPEIVCNIRDDYKIFLRYYGNGKNAMETVMYFL